MENEKNQLKTTKGEDVIFLTFKDRITICIVMVVTFVVAAWLANELDIIINH